MLGDIVDRRWDAIVIGTGMGGGTIGRRLAERGQAVLFVEKGPRGYRREETALSITLEDPFVRALRGFWPEPVWANVNGHTRQFFPPIGACVGGSSVYYAATLERPEPHDLDDSAERPHPTGGWPVRFSEMCRYFDEVHRLFSISGEPDPLAAVPAPGLLPAPLPGPGDRAIMTSLQKNGFHPYILHTAIRRLPGCLECVGRKCPLPCKMDGRSAGVEPALETGRAELLDSCEVVRLEGTARRIDRLVVRKGGKSFTLNADRIVLAAGALSSPRLLLESCSEVWPEGCANTSGLVGRNLMFHLNELFAIWPDRSASQVEASKQVGFRDLYHVDGQRYGIVQAMGAGAGYGEILHVLRQRHERSILRAVPGVRAALRVPAAVAATVLGKAKIFVGLLEDLPYPDNRVTADVRHPGQIHIEYTFTPELLARRRQFRRLIRKAFRGQAPLFLTYEPEPNFGHPSGTLRMGADPRTSVLDSNCRAHDIENLWVVDASFMPTSMGVNPSFTIAANALRVADRITS